MFVWHMQVSGRVHIVNLLGIVENRSENIFRFVMEGELKVKMTKIGMVIRLIRLYRMIVRQGRIESEQVNQREYFLQLISLGDRGNTYLEAFIVFLF